MNKKIDIKFVGKINTPCPLKQIPLISPNSLAKAPNLVYISTNIKNLKQSSHFKHIDSKMTC